VPVSCFLFLPLPLFPLARFCFILHLIIIIIEMKV
jgi:hypothetical protein